MTPLKLLRKLVKLVRGGSGHWQIVSGCLLGVLIGMTPGLNLTVMIAAALLLVLNANFALAVVGFAVGKVLCLALAPLTFRIGFALIHGIGLEGVFRAISRTPVLALMDLHYYCLVGGLPIAIALGLAGGWGLGRVIRLIRVGLKAGSERSERARRIAGSLPVRVLLRVLFGKQRASLAEMLDVRHPVFRKSGLVLAGVAIAVIVVFEWIFIDRVARAGMTGALEAAVGAEVNIEDVDLSIFGGSLKVTGLQVTDPDRPARNMVRIAALTADVSLADLLARRFVIDEAVVAGCRTDAPRSAPGKVFRKPAPTEVEVPGVDLSQYFENARKLAEYLRKLREYLREREKSHEPPDRAADKERLKELARRRGYLKLSAASVLAKRPAVTIRRLRIEGLTVGGPQRYRLEGEEVCDKPELNDRPMRLSVSGGGVEGTVKLDFTSAEAMHEVRLRADGVPLGGAIRLSERVPVDLTKASADVLAEGTFNSRTIHLPVAISLRNVTASGRAGRGALGLDPATTAKMFEKITALKIVVVLEGPLSAPVPRIDEKQTLAGLKDSLLAVGAATLASQAGRQAEKYLDSVPIKLPFGKGGPGDVLGGLRGLLPGGKDTDAGKDPDRPKTPASRPAGILDRLLR